MTSIICSVRGCHNNWTKRRNFMQQECVVHRPQRRFECACRTPYDLHPPPREENALRLWVKALNLKKPPKRPFVCSFHFVDKKPTKEHPYPEKWLGSDAPLKTPCRVRQSDNNATSSMEHQAMNQPVVPNVQRDAVTVRKDHTLIDHTYSLSLPLMRLPTTADQGKQCTAEPLHRTVLRTEALSLLYTGLSLPAFYSVVEHLIPLYKGSFQLDPTDQLLLTLMKFKLNLLQDDLAERFGVSQSVIKQVLSYWIDVMEENMREYIPWLPRETIRVTMPQWFKEHYPGTTCIIHFSETPLQKASNLDPQAEPFSHYYTQDTIKYLVAIAPCGLIMFISPAYGGRSSDKFITSNSGFLEYLHPGDEVLTNRVITIRDLLSDRKVKLLSLREAQLCEEDTTSTRRIANVRVHVERIICRLKHFRIISQVVPVNLVSKTDKILRICAALCNLRGNIMHEDV